jgi:ribonuclease T2
MKLTIKCLGLALLLLSVAGFAEPSCVVQNKKKLYRLDLSVPATFCKGRVGSDPSCRKFPKPSLIQLHGLWPNYEQGYPEGRCGRNECKLQSEAWGKYCKYPEPKGLYQSAAWQALGSDYMAGRESCLERHEWVNHGTCSPMPPVDYFQWSLEKTKQISEALAIQPNQSISRADLNHRIQNKLPDLNGAIRLSCKGKWVAGLYVLYEWGNPPGSPIKTSGGENSFGNCPNKFVFPSQP